MCSPRIGLRSNRSTNGVVARSDTTAAGRVDGGWPFHVSTTIISYIRILCYYYYY